MTTVFTSFIIEHSFFVKALERYYSPEAQIPIDCNYSRREVLGADVTRQTNGKILPCRSQSFVCFGHRSFTHMIIKIGICFFFHSNLSEIRQYDVMGGSQSVKKMLK